MASGTIIFLNGTSSAGKTSIARAFQQLVDVPYMHLAVDLFLHTIPMKYWESSSLGAINPTFAAFVSGFHHSIAAFVGAGNNLIVDHVLQEPLWWAECAQLLAPLRAVLVQVFCPLDELERREAARGDRVSGLARFQFHRVYRDTLYDLAVDTSHASAVECAAQILAYVRAEPPVSAFEGIRANTKR
jgi:chloramphenicol 3-O phosphotransferase